MSLEAGGLVPWLRGWVMTLALTSLVAGMAEAVTPDGSMRKYVRVALGMIIVSLVLQPVMAIVQRVRGEPESLVLPFGTTVPAVSGSGTGDETFAARVKWQVETMALSVEGVKAVSCRVTVRTGGGAPAVQRVDVQLWLDPQKARSGSAVREALKALLSAYLGTEPGNVVVSIAG